MTPKTDASVGAVALNGCLPTPLASYLKAVGVLRLVGEQADPNALGWWDDTGFRVLSRMGEKALVEFFLERYRPSPILAPWNSGSGFYPDKMSARKGSSEGAPLGIDPIRFSEAPRFEPLRNTIAEIRSCLRDLGLVEGMRSEHKDELLQRLRGELNDDALTWLDAAVLIADGASRYPPLLGTGGNDGRLDFTNNFLQRLVELFDRTSGMPNPGTEALLHGALFGEAVPHLGSSAIGQFAPSALGGTNSGTGFSGGGVVNPWDFVLMLEGAVLFAASTSRRLESAAPGRMAYPFTVRSTGAGSGSTSLEDEGPARGEIWMPLWGKPTSLREIRTLLGEGRAVLNGRPARDGLDFVRAVSNLGVDRGISEFIRYGFMMRNGKAFLATPLNRVRVRRNPGGELINELDRRGWLSALKSASSPTGNAPARFVSLGRQLQDGLFRMAGGEGGEAAVPGNVQQVLVTLGRIQRYLASAPKSREALGPVPLLGADWVRRANDATPEFLVAVALAGLRAERKEQGAAAQDGTSDDPSNGKPSTTPQGLRMALHLAPVAETPIDPGWDEESREVVWGNGDLPRSLVSVLERRLLRASQEGIWEKPLMGVFGAPLGAVSALLMGSTTFDRRVMELLPGLCLTRTPRSLHGAEALEAKGGEPLPISYAMLKPFFTPERDLHRVGLLRLTEEGGVRAVPLTLGLVRQVWSEPAFRPGSDIAFLPSVDRHLRRMALVPPHRFRSSGPDLHEQASPGVSSAIRGVNSLGVDGRRLLAALMVPLSDRSLRSVSERLFPPTAHLPGAPSEP